MRHLLQSHLWSGVDDCVHSLEKLNIEELDDILPRTPSSLELGILFGARPLTAYKS